MEWTKQLSIGNRTLDLEHKELLHIINWMDHLIEVADPVTLSQAFELFEGKLQANFADEEKIAQAINIDFTDHKLTHQQLLMVFGQVKEGVWTTDGMPPKNEAKIHVSALKNKFIQHIMIDGKPLKIVLDTCLYDFKPD